MPETGTLLWEVGCEELPAWACDAAAAQLPGIIEELIEQERLEVAGASGVRVLVGPRRFAAVATVGHSQREVREERRGPAARVAFEDGDPSAPLTRAGAGFARSMGLEASELQVREQDGSPFVFGVRELPAEPFAAVWPRVAQRALERLQFRKPMRWGSGSQRFVRPVRWMVTLLDDAVVDYAVWGVASGATTQGHRFLGPCRTVRVERASAYEEALAGVHVEADQDERRRRIEADLDAAAANAVPGGAWTDPGGVMDEVVHLVEAPTVITGSFGERYLELPERVLVTAMQSHQRYLPVRAADALVPRFLAVMNGDPESVDQILPGYERVLAGRLDDAVFSFGRDRARGLDDMATDASLGAVVFHVAAGSLADRRDRIGLVAADLAEQAGVDVGLVRDAARLAKADQVSMVVQEFAELEGFAGSLYAADAGYDIDVCRAIDQQFLPRSATGALADPGVPAVLALADKLELLVTMFAIGETPTGSRDPHGLRRAAIGVMRTILDHDLPIDVDAALAAAGAAARKQRIGDVTPEMLGRVREFMLDRVEKRLVDDGVRVDAVRAARAAGLPRLQHLDGLARAIQAAVGGGDEQLAQVITALRRCANILEDAAPVDGDVDPAAFTAEAEGELHDRLAAIAPDVERAVHDRRFTDAVAAAAQLGPAVDAFFDRERGVMVMAEDPALRDNRLRLLRMARLALAPLGDLTELQV